MWYVRPGTTIAFTGSSRRNITFSFVVYTKKDGRTINPAIQTNIIKQTSMDSMLAGNIGTLKD
ncbi:MAG: hypothetical protein J6A70_01450 [Prevotella sp.]|nr:hypothetical protein [Prevotella sp.]